MLDLLFGVMLAAAPLNDPMDDKALDERRSVALSAGIGAIEPAAGSAAPGRAAGLGDRRASQIGNHR